MSICVVDGKSCRCQPEEGSMCPGVVELRGRIAELERLLDVERRAVAAANQSADIALKWEADAKKAGKRVDELEKALREVGEHRCGECYECAVVINKAIGLMGG